MLFDKNVKSRCSELLWTMLDAPTEFYRISPLFILLTRRKTLKALYSGQLSSATVPAYLMLYLRARKQPKDPADNSFQRCQDITMGLKFFKLIF